MEDRNESLKRLYVIHPAARGLSDEGHCRLLTAGRRRTGAGTDVEYAKPAVPIAVNKMIINNADDSDVGRIEALQYTRLVATDDDRVKADSNMIKLPTIGWNPAGLVESGPSYTSYISAAIYFVRGRHLAWCPTNVKMQLEWN